MVVVCKSSITHDEAGDPALCFHIKDKSGIKLTHSFDFDALDKCYHDIIKMYRITQESLVDLAILENVDIIEHN